MQHISSRYWFCMEIYAPRLQIQAIKKTLRFCFTFCNIGNGKNSFFVPLLSENPMFEEY